jgi:hypothetical protein
MGRSGFWPASAREREKGVQELLTAAASSQLTHQVQVALGTAGFEATPGNQQRLLDTAETSPPASGRRSCQACPGTRSPPGSRNPQ